VLGVRAFAAGDVASLIEKLFLVLGSVMREAQIASADT